MGDSLDAELLALAGEDSSSDQDDNFSPAPHKSPSPRQSSSQPPHRESDSADMGRRGTAVVKKPQKPKRRSARKDESEEEGEASSIASRSKSSAPMSESESEGELSEPAAGTDGAPYPYQKYFYSAADKDKIEALPELEREVALSERRETYERWAQDSTIRRMLLQRQKEEAARNKNKRKADAADLDENQRKSSRQKTTLDGRKVGETDPKLEAYKLQRAQAGERKLLSPTKSKSQKRSPGSFSSADAEAESETEWDVQKNSSTARRSDSSLNDEPMEYADVSRLVIGRHDLTKYAFYPTFETSIVGTFVRGLVGMMPAPTSQDPNHVEPDYRLGQVSKVIEGPAYAFETKEGRRYVTKQYVVTADNGKVRRFPFIHVSRDEKITSREYARWRADLDTHSIKPPMKSSSRHIINAMTNLTHYEFSSKEISDKVAKQNSLKALANQPNRTLVAKFTEMRDKAVEAGDDDEVARVEEEMRHIKPAPLAFNTQLYPNTPAPTGTNGERKLSEGERIAALNARNRRLNTEHVRRAQIAERRAAQRRAELVARGEAEVDSFARIKTRPKTKYDAKNPHGRLTVPKDDLFSGSDHSRAVTPASGNDAALKTDKPHVKPHRPMNDEEAICAMDIELDPEVARSLGL